MVYHIVLFISQCLRAHQVGLGRKHGQEGREGLSARRFSDKLHTVSSSGLVCMSGLEILPVREAVAVCCLLFEVDVDVDVGLGLRAASTCLPVKAFLYLFVLVCYCLHS
jgi:hypothetical protein